MNRPVSTELQFAFDALVLKAEDTSNPDDLKNSKEMDCFLNMLPADIKENAHMFNLIMNYKKENASLLTLMKNINKQYATSLFWNLNRQEDFDINEIRTYSLNLNWFLRLFFPNALMVKLDEFDPYSPNGTKADDIYAAYNQPTGFIDGSLNWIGKHLLSGLKKLANLILANESTIDDTSSYESQSSKSDSESDDEEAPIENKTSFEEQQTQQDVVFPSPIHLVKATIFKPEDINLEKNSTSNLSNETRNGPSLK